jgi:hypothetical protein
VRVFKSYFVLISSRGSSISKHGGHNWFACNPRIVKTDIRAWSRVMQLFPGNRKKEKERIGLMGRIGPMGLMAFVGGMR